jgi:hypothetical protein
MRSPARFARFLSVVLLSAGCTHATTLQVPLVWRGENVVDLSSDVLTAFTDQSVDVFVVSDQRTRLPGEIGENIEEPSPRPVTTRDDVLAFITSCGERLFRMNGLRVHANASRLIRLDVLEFFVSEEHTYQGRVVLGVTLVNKSGDTLWRGTVKGASHRIGRSMSGENYEESLTSATVDAFKELLDRRDFQQAVRG